MKLDSFRGVESRDSAPHVRDGVETSGRLEPDTSLCNSCNP